MLRSMTGAALAAVLALALSTGAVPAQDAGTAFPVFPYVPPVAAAMPDAAASPANVAVPEAAAGLTLTLPVLVTSIAPGEIISEGMITEKPFPASVANRYPIATRREQLTGKVAKRVLGPDVPVPVNAVTEPKLVVRGTATQIRFEQDGLRITAVGVPLENGVLGATIRLKNADTGQMVTGVVQADGSVKVGFQ
ncbi:flagellar basal body P-ring formation chaperone FlgA [Ancylobacter lacus]|uniref:flagellar basal body P-ring formation chaperone FlgA n=1 Tax=Ancylobacter lacus TaxID=2579970 RepID=UPI001BCF6E43|nr:flagellar basal body P-ring formation chaperone FlgA [Ancylobacter lacus]MBS7537941.1 flagellar basal body P-ring formation protein FlgA [Ancylobacter lacus]